MSWSLRISVLAIGIALLGIIFYILKKGRIPTKFALVWLVPTFAILLVAIYPQLITYVASIFGFVTITNFIIGFLIVILFCLIIALTIIVSGQNTKITLLIQEVSMLKKMLEDREDNHE